MENPADNDHSIHDLLKKRWSPRAFSDEPVGDEALRSLFEAARWAPSSFNDQPWHFIVGSKARSPETYQALYDCLAEGNQEWADGAPVLALSVARTRFQHNGKENKHALHDVGLAVENLVIEAMSRDIYVHQMAGFSEEAAHENFHVPDGQKPVAAFAIGHLADPESLPEGLRERETSERTRKSLDEFVYSGEWGSPSSIIEEGSGE